MKALLAHNTLIAYPYHNLPFHIYTDASEYHLGSVIMQQNKPVAFTPGSIHQLNGITPSWRKNFFPLLRHLKTFIPCYLELHVYTNHYNLTFNTLSSLQVMH